VVEREAVVDWTVEVLDGCGVESRAVDLYDDIPFSILLLLLATAVLLILVYLCLGYVSIGR